MGFWDKAKETSKDSNNKEVIINLQEQLSKLEYSDVDYIYNLLLEKQYRGRATTVLLKIRFIRNQLQESTNESTTKIKDD